MVWKPVLLFTCYRENFLDPHRQEFHGMCATDFIWQQYWMPSGRCTTGLVSHSTVVFYLRVLFNTLTPTRLKLLCLTAQISEPVMWMLFFANSLSHDPNSVQSIVERLKRFRFLTQLKNYLSDVIRSGFHGDAFCLLVNRRFCHCPSCN